MSERFDPARVQDHFNKLADSYDAGKERQTYYYDYLIRLYRERIPEGASVVDVGCGTGAILAALKPGRGLGLDLSPRMAELARSKHPALEFRAEDISRPAGPANPPYDFVLLSDVVEHLPDVDAALEGLKAYGGPQTRYIATCINPLWAPVMHLAEALGLKLPEGDHQWIGLPELCATIERHGYVMVEAAGRMLVPKRVPVLSDALNGLAERRPSLRSLCMIQVLTFRKS